MSIINISNLTKIYNNNTLALDNISLMIKKGEFFALLGKNGAGKSTTIGILTSLIKKDYGKINIYGYDFDKQLMEVKSLIGFVPQEFNFNQFESVMDIILNQAGFYGINRSIATDRAEFYLKFFDLWDVRKSISITLSGGMKRRLMMVRALIHKPEILILDEPTAGVDVLSRRLIWNFLKDFNKKEKTIILTTHYLEEVEHLCDNVAIIDKGSILLKSTVPNLLKNCSKNKILLDIKNIDKIKYLISNKYKFIIKGNNTVEILFLKKYDINDLFYFLIKNNIIINNIKSEHNRLEELFIKLIT